MLSLTDMKSSPSRSIPESDIDPPDTTATLGCDAKQEAKIIRITYKHFRSIKSRMDSVIATAAAIIVVYNDTDVSGISRGLEHVEGEETELQTPWQRAIRTHVVINSQILADILRSVIHWNLTDTQLISILPFKGIITHEIAIREAYYNLVMECDSKVVETDQKTSDNASSEGDDRNGNTSLEGSDESNMQPLDATCSPS
jgi:hypothetical protein